MVFKIDSNIVCDEMYIFPEDQLLIKSKLGYLKPIKDIFRQNAKTETLLVNFTPHKMSFSGIQNKKSTYDLQTHLLDRYGNYLAQNSQAATNYQIGLQMKHILGVLRIAEIVDGDLFCAMECIDEDSAICFIFTKNTHFTFNVGVASVRFENKDAEAIGSGQIAGVVVNPVRNNPNQRGENAASPI